MRVLNISHINLASAASEDQGRLILLFFYAQNDFSLVYGHRGRRGQVYMANIQCPHLGAHGDLRSDLRGYPRPKMAKTVFFTLARARPEPENAKPEPARKNLHNRA